MSIKKVQYLLSFEISNIKLKTIRSRNLDEQDLSFLLLSLYSLFMSQGEKSEFDVVSFQIYHFECKLYYCVITFALKKIAYLNLAGGYKLFFFALVSPLLVEGKRIRSIFED